MTFFQTSPVRSFSIITNDGRLIQSHVDGGNPVGRGIDGVAKAADATHGVSEVPVVVLERGH